MSNLMIILDGAQDSRYAELDGKTPMEHGERESIAAIRSAGTRVRLSTTPPGLEADTLVCAMTLLGVSREKLPSGRSTLEALAEGLTVGDDDLVLRCNYVKIAEDGTLEVPCCEPPEEVAQALSAQVAHRHNCTLKRIGPYKSLQIMEGARLHHKGLLTLPPHNHAGKPLTELLPHGNELADKLAETTLELYAKTRPYTVLNWAPSVREDVPLFHELHGFSGGVVTKTLVMEGISRIMGMSCPEIPGGTGDTDTDLAAKARATLEQLERNDFVVLHVGGTDEATHRRDPAEKAAFIAKLDRELLAPILDALPEGTRILLTSDHVALCSTAGHTEEPVEAYLYEKGKLLGGDLGLLPGTQAVPLLFGNWNQGA